MAYSDPLVLKDNAAVNQNFVVQSRLQGGVDYIEDDATTTDRRRISIRHSNAGPSVVKGSRPVRRHLFQVIHDKWNSTLGKQEKATLNITLTTDPGASITTAEILHLAAFGAEFLTLDANVEKLLRDEA